MNRSRIQVITRQAAVGQGGFMTCSVRIQNSNGHSKEFLAAFDCGSVNQEHLRQGLDALDDGPLDVLFISHLDADHCNGIDLLLNKVRVETVVLPCLDATSLTALICTSLVEGDVRGNFAAFLRDPTAWFAERGVKRVVFVTRDLEGDGGAPPFNPDDDGPKDRVRLKMSSDLVDSRLPYSVDVDGSVPEMIEELAVERHILPAATTLMVDLAAAGPVFPALNWLFLPYAHPFSNERMTAFRSALRPLLEVPEDTSLAPKSFTDKLLEILRDDRRRQELKNCYFHLSSDNNKPSLSLYSGPLPRESNHWCVVHANELYGWGEYQRGAQTALVAPPLSRLRGQSGWLSTGDANLKSKATRQSWLRRYDQLLDQVGVFQLPHHGSNESLHNEVIERVRGAMQIVCAAQGRAHHPHPELLVRLRARGMGVWQVSENQSSDFVVLVEG